MSRGSVSAARPVRGRVRARSPKCGGGAGGLWDRGLRWSCWGCQERWDEGVTSRRVT